MRSWLAVIASGLLLAGCETRGAVFLTVESPATDHGTLVVPDDVDLLRVTMRASLGEAPALAKDYPLDPAQHRFPLTLGVEAGEYEGDEVMVEVLALKGEQAVAEGAAVVQFDSEELTSFTIRLVARP